MRRKVLKADIARALGVSRSRITQLEREGMPLHSVAAAQEGRKEHCDQDRVSRRRGRLPTRRRRIPPMPR